MVCRCNVVAAPGGLVDGMAYVTEPVVKSCPGVDL
jgi:hypothetical protein